MVQLMSYTVNREYFIVKIFSDSLACLKIKNAQKYIYNVDDNAVQGYLSENYCTKYFRHEIFAVYGIL